MFYCPVCKTERQVQNRNDVFHHLNYHKRSGTIFLPLFCEQRDCHVRIGSIKNFVRHFENFHSDQFSHCLTALDSPEGPIGNHALLNSTDQNIEMQSDDSTDDSSATSSCFSDTDDEESQHETEDSDMVEDFVMDVLDEAFKIVLNLRCKSAIPYTTTVKILKEFATFNELFVNKISVMIENAYRNVQDLPDVQVCTQTLLKQLKPLSKVFQEMTSEWKIRKMYERHPHFVAPNVVKLGTDNNTNKYRTAEYISMESTMQSLVYNEEFYNNLLAGQHQPNQISVGVYKKFQDGSRFAQNKLFNEALDSAMTENEVGQSPKLMIQLFSDGVALSKSQSGTVFYFTLQNIQMKWNARNANIHLLAVCKSKDLKKENGYNKILGYIFEELSKLETTGFLLSIPGKGQVVFRGTLVQYTADNLGFNEAFGLVTSFNCDGCCLLCYATKQQMQSRFYEKEFELRTVAKYERDLQELNDTGANCVRGIKNHCVLNNLKYFHIIDNWINDSMHTVSEGIVPYVMSCVLHSLKIEQGLSVEFLNSHILLVFSSFIVNKQHKPPPLCEINMPGKGMSPTLSATQNLALFQYLPLILRNFVQRTSKPWKMFLMLQELVDIVFAPKINEAMLVNFEKQYANFLTLFRTLYPDRTITPKMHFIVHFPTIVRKNGPLKNFSVLSYERKNGEVKKPTHTMNNFRNPTKTLAYKAQCAALHSLVAKEMTSPKITFGKISLWSTSGLGHDDDNLQNAGVTMVETCDKFSINSTTYKKGMFVLLAALDCPFEFGKIDFIICEDKNQPLLSITVFQTIEFDQHSFCYVVAPKSQVEKRVTKIADLIDYHPLDGFSFGNLFLIRLKYYVW